MAILFPPFAAISSYPVSSHVIANNIYYLIMRQDMTQEPKYRFDGIFRLFLRFVAALAPILLAFGVANFIDVIAYVSPFTYICIFISSLLQVVSIYVCNKRFLASKSEYKEESETKKNSRAILEESRHLFFPARNVYMTPYSNKIASHPIVSCVVLTVGVCLFIISIANYFMPSYTVTC